MQNTDVLRIMLSVNESIVDMNEEASDQVPCGDCHVPRGHRVLSSKRINAKCHTRNLGKWYQAF